MNPSLTFATVLALLAGPVGVLAAQPLAEPSRQFSFDIASGPLAQALQQYAATTRRPTLYRSEIAVNRISAPLHGRYTAAAGLERLLRGSGLQIERFDDGAASGFILKTAPDAPDYHDPADYVAWLQRQIWRCLCGQRLAAPGAYRVLLHFRIDRSGRLQKTALLTSSGQAERDQAIRNALAALQLNILPPSMMPQPITLLIVPNDPQASLRCESEIGAAASEDAAMLEPAP